jgi:HNH endonuclease
MQKRPSHISPSDWILSRCAETDDGCLLWQGANNGKGYGRINVSGRLLYTHRVVYEAVNGPVPDGLVIDHLCRRTACCRPDHLEAVSVGENNLRGLGAGHREKVTCKRGHPFSRVYVNPQGGRVRVCDECARIRMAEFVERKRAG